MRSSVARSGSRRRLITLLAGAALLAWFGPQIATVASAAADAAGHHEARPQSVTAGRVTPRWSLSVNTHSRAAVDEAYRAYSSSANIPTGWTGNVQGCDAGTVSAFSTRATLTAINFARSMSGLAPVTFDAGLSAGAQQTALMMAANHTLSHSPASSWTCFSPAGAAAAARSDLALSSAGLGSSEAVDMYLDDDGSENTVVGHRRWLLNPFVTAMGNGGTDQTNAVTVVGPTSTSRPNPAWVSWPSAGYFPDALEPHGRWSLSAGARGTSFNRASVRVYHDGAAVGGVQRYAVQDGFAQNTLVWQMPQQVQTPGTYRVVVSGIRRLGHKHPLTHTYRVQIFVPSS